MPPSASRRSAPFAAAPTPCSAGGSPTTTRPASSRFDSKGRRLDVVEFHPAYHECMDDQHARGPALLGLGPSGQAGRRAGAGANVARSAGTYMAIQMEAGHQCPITMTNAAGADAAAGAGAGRSGWMPKILARAYDKSFAPAAAKRGVTIGMGMTEKQGGTDVRANTTAAEPPATAGPAPST